MTVNGEPMQPPTGPSLHGDVAVAAAEALAREQQRAGAVANIIASAVAAATLVALPMILFGAPTWAWIGIGVVAYLVVL